MLFPKMLAALLALAAAPAAAQPAERPIDALRADYPAEHAALAAQLAGKPDAEARALGFAAFEGFLARHRDALLGAPPEMLMELEARQAGLLRAVGRQDAARCAVIGDQGPFGAAAAAGAAPEGLQAFAAALVAAVKAGEGKAPGPLAGAGDYQAWAARVKALAPDVPVLAMLRDRELRARAGADHLCRGAIAMHEAAATLPGAAGERVSRALIALLVQPPRP